jgi:hypothetical protein
MSYDPFAYMPKEKPYALYVHGMGSGAKSGTKSSLGHYLDVYEWLSPELPVEPEEAMAILEDYVRVFSPALIAGTSLGGLYLLYLNAPEATKVAINPTYNIETTLRRIGYGKHPFHCEREDSATEYTIDEPLVKRYMAVRDNRTPQASKRMVALFSTDDELVGREPAKQNASALEHLGYEIHWCDKFGHRLNQPAAKLLAKIHLETNN